MWILPWLKKNNNEHNVTNQINSQTHWTEWGVKKGEAAGSENKYKIKEPGVGAGTGFGRG